MSPLARAFRIVTVAPLKAVVIMYRYSFSAVLGHSCRFRPTCSEYALEALDTHGAFRGGWLAARRLLRCHPWGGSGYDPVPPAATDHDPRQGVAATPGAAGRSERGL